MESSRVYRRWDDLCDWYGTATMQEALRVRSVSGEKPILVFGYVSDEEIRLAAENNITLSAFSATFLSHISECCAGMNLKAAVHLKLDTGFHRMGKSTAVASTADCVEQLLPLFSLPNIEITGMYTHLVYGAGSNQRGAGVYRIAVSALSKLHPGVAGTKNRYGHLSYICNSKAAIHAPDMHMDMVRVGAYIFGLASAPEQRLIPLREVLVWKARIVLLRDIAAGEGVGYGHAFTAKQPVRIAVLAAGFADGYRRCIAQSPQSYVSIHGRPAPLIGKVCMDMFMVDVTDIEAVQVGEYALLSGDDGTGAVSSYLLGQIIQGTAGEIAVVGTS